MTIDDLILKVQELVRLNPDNKYNRGNAKYCNYKSGSCTNGSVGCIFGQAFTALGYNVPNEWDEDNRYIMDIVEKVFDECNTYKAKWCGQLQSVQDQGGTWGQALDYANKRYPIEVGT